MTIQDQSRMTLHGETQPTSQRSLEACLTRTALLFSKTLTVDEGQVWKEFLATYSSAAIEYAFENWQRNGRFFPKPADILELIRAFYVAQRDTYQAADYGGGGYGSADCLALWKLFHEKYPKPVGRPLTREERKALIDELDRRKQAIPA